MKKFILFVACIMANLTPSSMGTPLQDNGQTYHRYLLANYNHFAGKKDQADDWYKKLLSSTHSPYTYKGYLPLLVDTQHFKQIVHLMPSLSKKFENDSEIQLIFVDALEKTHQLAHADNHLISISQRFKTHSEIVFRAAQTYIRRKEPENALLTINGFLNNTPRRPNNFVFYFLKTQIYLSLGKFTDALQNIQTCLELHPHFEKGWLLCASLCEKEGKIKEALAGYANFIELTGGNSTVEQHLTALMFKYKTMQNSSALIAPHKVTIENALLLFKQKRYNQALEHINSCIQQTPTTDCKLLKLQILSAMNNFKHAAASITEWATAEPDTDVWAQSLYLLAQNGMPRTQVIATGALLIQQIPHNPWFNLYCADLCMRESRTDQAITYLTNALACTLENTLRIKTLYQLALAHYEQNNHQAMLTNLEKAYALDNYSPHINNALAYYWATKGKDVAKAHAFIAHALATDKTNPYFLDTYAVILYKEKKYEAAQSILENLVLCNNGTMLLHLAKVHYALKNKENADTFTKKAQTVVKNFHEKKALNKMEMLLTRS